LITLYNAIAGSCAEDEANAGGGGSPPPPQIPFTIGVDASSGANNAMTGGLHNQNIIAGSNYGAYIDFADGTSGTSAGQSTYGTASSPTRTTQTAHVRTSEVAASYSTAPVFEAFIYVGGYVRQGNMGAISNIHWQIAPTITSSLSNGTFTSNGVEVSDANEHNQNNVLVDGHSMNSSFTFIPQGIYASKSKSNGSAFRLFSLRWGGGRGSPTFPAVNDTITLQLAVSADVGGTTFTKLHDFIIKFI
tara:strand:- start:358 stop:1098 length:741 start_codon:yes stop_codon:yes gene_type:complete